MPKLKVLPGHVLCPAGTEIEAKSGVSICDTLLGNGIEIEHACEKQAACTTCHVILRKGFDSLDDASEKEEDMLDKAWGLEATSRLSCQAKVADADVERMLRDSFEHANEDMHARALAEHRVDGERLIEATRSALQADVSLLHPGEIQIIEKAIETLQNLLPTTDHRAIKKAADALNRATEEFAARRMDAGVRRVLAGRKIGSL